MLLKTPDNTSLRQGEAASDICNALVGFKAFYPSAEGKSVQNVLGLLQLKSQAVGIQTIPSVPPVA